MAGIKPINMDSDTFAVMKQDMTDSMNRLIRNMQRYNSDKGTMTVKITISLEEQDLDNSEKGDMPTFEHKVSTSVQIKDEKSGKLNGEYLLEEDGKGGYIIRPLIEQEDMFEETVE